MVTGSSNVNLDAKGRIAIPTKHRDALQNASEGKMVVTISVQERCLLLYTQDKWKEVQAKLINLPTLNASSRKLRMMLGHAEDCEMDLNGRLVLPAPLREFASLQKKVAIVGFGDKFEIWDENNWIAHRESLLSVPIDQDDLPPELIALTI